MIQRFLKSLVLLVAAASASACKTDSKGDAFISFNLSSDYNIYTSDSLTELFKSSDNDIFLPDTNDFILKITSAAGKEIYNGPYGSRPKPVQVDAGSYNLVLQSVEFPAPQFSAPVFGDSTTIIIGNGQSMAVTFGCTQLNCGMRLIFTDSFRNRFFNSTIAISSAQGSLQYPYTESRIAYFQPGILRVTGTEGGTSRDLLARHLSAADILTVKLSASEDNTPENFSINIDTSRNWVTEDYMIGSGNNGSTPEKAFTIAELPLNLGATEVWVCGYIVGGDVSTSNMSFQPPFTKDTHFALSDSRSVSSREDCAAVELTTTGGIRESLNLVSHPEYFGLKIYIKGDVENYFGHPGIKKVKEYRFE